MLLLLLLPTAPRLLAATHLQLPPPTFAPLPCFPPRRPALLLPQDQELAIVLPSHSIVGAYAGALNNLGMVSAP